MKLGGFPERIWRSRWPRALFLAGALVALGTVIAPGPQPGPQGAGEAALIYTPIAFDPGDPARRDVGRLHFLGGWSLSSPDARLGGLSGLHVEQGQALAVSDTGMVATFPLPGASLAPRIRFQPVLEGPGARRTRRTRDSEGLQVAGDQLWLSFERYNAVWRYDRASLRAQSGARPEAIRRWPGNNDGPEGIARLADGRFLVLHEAWDDGAPTSEVALFAGDPAVPGTAAIRLRYRRPHGYRVTDATALPDGRVLILSRGMPGLRFSAKLEVIDVTGLRANAVIVGREVATLEAPLVIDNMEGVSATLEGGRTVIWLVSDDDFMRLFRHTLLLKFELRL